ncbi:TRAP transporter substrate-binding protein [Microbaculum marinisediminis]|uniref:TRAP transporter substrate-binding protein n=1 Tax=Microbaculum marinisediminis TaxID=2931392 RepID=A0AAW5QTV4_9HYPH|nr:TRAP transporter substrate-binding protein [Microbaculum sp. A6E488]MCT8970435.1 TRAP transporter substrate-binding protein [Microbaculum sp. A6E488]
MKKLLAVSALALGVGFAGAAKAEQWNMQSTYPGSLTQLGTLGKHIAEQLKAVTDGDIELVFQEPGALVPALEVFDAVASGAVEAGWSTPGYWAGKVPALQLFAAVPFGPQAGEYIAWMKFGGGKELFDEIYEKYGIHSVTCGVIAPEASGWFKNEIKSVDDLKGLKMRFFGLGAKVMEKMGVSTQLLAGGDIFPALELGTIDATEFSMPAIDLNLGFYQVAKHYYFPGWHQQATLFDLMINLDLWESLSDTQKAQIETVCDAAIAYGLAEGEAIQFKALQELEKNGVQIHRWPPEILDQLKAAWDEVVAEQVAADADFARVWESLATFRENYKKWKDLGYLD